MYYKYIGLYIIIFQEHILRVAKYLKKLNLKCIYNNVSNWYNEIKNIHVHETLYK